MATFRAIILTGPGQIRADGYANIKIKIQQGKDIAYIKTDLFILPSEFENGQSTGPTAGWINKRILDYLTQFTDAYLRLGDRSYSMTAGEIRSAVTAPQQKVRVDFIRFADEYLDKLITAGKNGSQRRARSVIVHLKRFAGKLFFDEINSSFLQNFEAYLRREGVTNAIPTYMTSLRVIFNRGRDQYNDPDRGVIQIQNYPFARYKIKMRKGSAKENALTVDQLRKLLNYPCQFRREQLTQDVFKIMILMMGPNTKDIFNMPQPKKGRVNYSRSKTGHRFSIKIEKELNILIEKYKGENTLFSFIQDYKDDANFQRAINEGLKSLCKRMGVQRITTNWARHTWATIARMELQAPREDISRCLGHSSGSVTDEYIRYNYEIEDRLNRKMIDLLFVLPAIHPVQVPEVCLN